MVTANNVESMLALVMLSSVTAFFLTSILPSHSFLLDMFVVADKSVENQTVDRFPVRM